MKTIAVFLAFALSISLAQANGQNGQGKNTNKKDNAQEPTQSIVLSHNLNGFNEFDVVSEAPFFFGEDVFDSELFSPIVGVHNFDFLHNHPIVGTYFLMIYPAVIWLDEESLNLIEIL